MARVALQEYSDTAHDLVEAGAVEQAIAICRHILKRYPQHIPTYEVLARACLAKGEYHDAIDLYKRILAADPENMRAYAAIGIVLERLGNVVEAAWYMERALELTPGNEEVRDAMRRLYGKVYGAEPRRLKLTKLALARMYAKGGQHRQAIDEMTRLLELEPQRMDIRISLTEALWLDGRHEQAAELACEILEDCPFCLKATLLLALIEKARDRSTEAEEIVARTRSMDPEHRLAYAFFGDASPVPIQTVRIPTIESAGEPETAEEQALTDTIAVEGVPGFEADTAAVKEPDAEFVANVPRVEPEAVAPQVEPGAEAAAGEESSPEGELLICGASAPPVEAATAPVIGSDAPLRTEESEAVPAVLDEPKPRQDEASPPTAMSPSEEPADEAAGATLATQDAAPGQETLAAPGLVPNVQMEIERYRQQIEQYPKDNNARLGLARAYTGQEQIKLALEQYRFMAKAKGEVLAQAIQDVEGIIASRPDNLEAHELLADLYTQDGQLARAVERYRWILERLAKP